MRFDQIRSHLEGVPYIDPKRAKILYDFVVEERPSECLELGFAHGASSCYIAAALDENGLGHLTSVDLLKAEKWEKPSIEELLASTGLTRHVTVVRENTSYNWFLKKEIEAHSLLASCAPIYDFCFVDGAKNWTIDGFAFFLIDKLLKPNGYILFDDFDWTYAASSRTHTDGINHRELGTDELELPHIELVFRLLVMQHQDYSQFKIQDGTWAWARKTARTRRTLTLEETYTYKTLFLRGLRRLGRGLRLGALTGV